jgi:hypothetical protein
VEIPQPHRAVGVAGDQGAGVSIWLADFGRQRLRDEGWAGLVTGRHVVGAITNPTIFATAITGSGAYEEELRDLALLNVEVDEATHGVDGRVHYLSRIDERPCRPRWPRNPRERPWTACISSSTLRPHTSVSVASCRTTPIVGWHSAGGGSRCGFAVGVEAGPPP